MNYTENYHLPQWDESDRILRADFNQMCEDIENGLMDNSADTESLGARQRETVDCLHRLAYNHYCALQRMNVNPWQIGVFSQNPARDGSGVTGMKLFDGVCFAGKNSTRLTHEVLSQNYQELTPLKVVKGNLAKSSPLTARFTPPASGRFLQFSLHGSYTGNSSGSVSKFLATLTNRATGAVEQSRTVEVTLTNSDGLLFDQRLDAVMHFLGGVEYIFTLEPLTAVSNFEGGIGFNQYTQVEAIANDSPITASYQFHEQEGGSGGMVILRCMTGGAGGVLTLTWDGQARQPSVTRQARAADGRIVQELIYFRSDSIPADSSLSLRFECREGGSFLFYDWGAILL